MRVRAALPSSVRPGRGGQRRMLSGVLAAVVAVPLAWSLAGAHGLTGARTQLAGGDAWLASPAQGLITLVDGASAQVIGSIRVPAAPWLSASSSSITIPPGGTGSVTVTGVGTPPADGLNTNVLGFRLDNGSTVNYDFLVNLPPVLGSVNCIATRDNSIPVTVFGGSVTDADPSGVHAVLTVGPFTRDMGAPISVSGNQVSFSFPRQQNLSTGETFSITFTDSGGLAVTGTGTRTMNPTACWP
jgi:hypothetical protein